MPAPVIMEGIVKKERLELTFKQLIRQYESFRTSFLQVKGEAVQRIHDKVEFEIEYVDSGSKEQGAEPKKVSHVPFTLECSSIIKNFIHPFKLSRAPLLRVGLAKLEKEKYLLIMDIHHIVSDGVSTAILEKVFMSSMSGKPLCPVKIQYKDFSQWWDKEKKRETVTKQGHFWAKEFTGEISVLHLPCDYPRPMEHSYEGSVVGFELDEKETAALKQLAKEESVTLFMVMLALYNVFLGRLSGQEDIVVGTPVAGRYRVEIQDTIGMFVNTLALRNFPKGTSTFRDFLGELKERTLNALENQNYPFEELVEQVASQWDKNRNPLFDVMFALQNMDTPEIHIPGLTIKPISYEQRTAKFDLNLVGIEGDRNLVCFMEFSVKLFNQSTIERFVCYFKDILWAVLENKDIRLKDITINISLESMKIATPVIEEAKGEFEF
jgi:hypothetical protein